MSTEREDQNGIKTVSYSVDLSSPNAFTALNVNPVEKEETTPPGEPVSQEELDSNTPDPTDIEVEVREGDQTESDSPEVEEDSDINPYYYLGDALKNDGYLPETLEVNEKVDGSSIYNAYKQKLREDLEPQVRQEIYQKLEEEGVVAQDLILARAIRQGVDYRLLSTGSLYERNATLPDDVPDDKKVEVVKQMYQLRNFNDTEINKLVTSAEADDSVDVLFVEAKNFFGEKYNKFVQDQNEDYDRKVQAKNAEAKRVEEVIRNIVTTGEVMGEKLTKTQVKEFEDAIRKTDQTVEFEGRQYKGSEMQKFLLEWESSPELKFLLFKLYKFRGQQNQEVKNEVQKTVENDFLKAYKTKVISSKKPESKNKAIANSMETTKATAASYFIDLGK